MRNLPRARRPAAMVRLVIGMVRLGMAPPRIRLEGRGAAPRGQRAKEGAAQSAEAAARAPTRRWAFRRSSTIATPRRSPLVPLSVCTPSSFVTRGSLNIAGAIQVNTLAAIGFYTPLLTGAADLLDGKGTEVIFIWAMLPQPTVAAKRGPGTCDADAATAPRGSCATRGPTSSARVQPPRPVVKPQSATSPMGMARGAESPTPAPNCFGNCGNKQTDYAIFDYITDHITEGIEAAVEYDIQEHRARARWVWPHGPMVTLRKLPAVGAAMGNLRAEIATVPLAYPISMATVTISAKTMRTTWAVRGIMTRVITTNEMNGTTMKAEGAAIHLLPMTSTSMAITWTIARGGPARASTTSS